jgi:hypothetical protein
MCDYSLQQVASRPATVGETLITHNFGSGTRGFRSPDETAAAVCLLPGTELAFKDDIRHFGYPQLPTTGKTAIFRQINKDNPHTHHDALEFPDGQMVLLTQLIEGQEATVLQLPAQPQTAEEAEAQARVAFVG